MANNRNAFYTELGSLLNSTTNIDNATKTDLLAAILDDYQVEWNALLASGTANTAVNQRRFVAKKAVDFYSDHTQAYRRRVDIAAVPTRGGID